MSNHDELIAQFIEISGGEENVARFYLSSSNWSLEDALANFLGSQSENDNADSEETVRPAATAMDDTSQSASERAGASSGAGGGAEEGFSKSSAKPKFATLNDMEKSTDNDEEEGQAFYAGGSERSGQQVLGPPKRKNFREQLTDMFRMAQEHGSGETAPTPSTSTGVSWGQGVRLGMTDSDHSVVSAPGAANKEGGEKGPVVVLKLWSQGFSINDGELRLYDDPENKEFLETVMRGEIPHELLEMGWMVNVDVEDHRHEEYKKGPKSTTFKGSGHALGSPAPNVTGMVAAAAPTAPAALVAAAVSNNSSDDEKRAKEKLNLNAAAPLTTLQIRLADGSRLAAQFNLSHTVADIHEYIQNARPQYAERNFILVSSFPTCELTDNAATIEKAGLKNAAIMQRLK